MNNVLLDPQMFNMLADNVIYGIAAFLAIVVWVKTRDSSWIMMVLAVLGFYAAAVYRTLLFFGIIISGEYVYYGIDAMDAAFRFIPAVLLVSALAVRAVKNMRR